MKIGSTLPPTAAPVSTRDLFRGMSGLFGNEYLEKLENEIREYFRSDSVFLVSSGKAALVLILKGLASIRPRKKVLIPAYTCYSVPSAIVKSGLEIVLCDVEPDTLDFDYPQLELLADDKTLCIVSTHLFGIPADVDRTRRICEEKGIFLVEDAAQAMGVSHKGRKLGTLGDVGFFSLGRGKNISCGSGGIILTSSEEIATGIRVFHRELGKEKTWERFRDVCEILFTNLFLNPYLYWLPYGLPFLGIGETRFMPDFPMYRFSNSKAAVLGRWQERMEEYNLRRFDTGRRYIEELSLGKERKIHSGNIPYLRFPLYAKSPEHKRQICTRGGVLGISPMYPEAVNRIVQLRRQFAGSEYTGAERIASTLMTLPTHILLKESDRKTICNTLAEMDNRGETAA